ncbi:hypothetical protein [Burkholderia ubonensis]|uniref:AbrB/MazE/SpoVT family DNA-binding domain-containing protein n=1 Tax=Burkholderia ubonensis TaxID=101571 RepID=UPI000A749A99|nr:hypothetical protein [Burkholderia ubonensis]
MNETYELKDLICGITPENLHDEVSFGRPVGREVWPPFDNDPRELENHPVAD